MKFWHNLHSNLDDQIWVFLSKWSDNIQSYIGCVFLDCRCFIGTSTTINKLLGLRFNPLLADGIILLLEIKLPNICLCKRLSCLSWQYYSQEELFIQYFSNYFPRLRLSKLLWNIKVLHIKALLKFSNFVFLHDASKARGDVTISI